MAFAKRFEKTQTITLPWYNSSGYPVGMYSPVCIDSSSRAVLPTISSNMPTTRIIGITNGFAQSGQPVEIITSGFFWVIANAAITVNTQVFCVAVSTALTNTSAPYTNLPETLPKIDAQFGSLSNICTGLVDDPTISAATTGANAVYYPIGWAMEAASAQYDVITVQLDLMPFYA